MKNRNQEEMAGGEKWMNDGETREDGPLFSDINLKNDGENSLKNIDICSDEPTMSSFPYFTQTSTHVGPCNLAALIADQLQTALTEIKRSTDNAVYDCAEKVKKTQYEINKLHEEKDELSNQRSKLETEIIALTETVETLKTENFSMKEKEGELLTSLNLRNSCIQELNNNILQLQGENDALSHRQRQLESEVGSLFSKIQVLENEQELGKKREEELLTDLSLKNTHIQELNQRVKQLQMTSEQLNNDNKNFVVQLTEEKGRIEIFEQSLEEAHFHLVSLAQLYQLQEKALEASDKENQELKSKHSIVSEKKLQNTKRKPAGPISYLNSIHDSSAIMSKYK